MRWQSFLDEIQEVWSGQPIEKGVGVGVRRRASNITLLLLSVRGVTTMHGGWILAWWAVGSHLHHTTQASPFFC